MKVSALIAATLLVVSVSANADHHEEKGAMPAAPAAAAKPAKGAKTTTTTTTTTAAPGAAAPAAAAHPHADHHADCKTLKGTAKADCMKHEKTAHAAGAAEHTHAADTKHDEAHTH